MDPNGLWRKVAANVWIAEKSDNLQGLAEIVYGDRSRWPELCFPRDPSVLQAGDKIYINSAGGGGAIVDVQTGSITIEGSSDLLGSGIPRPKVPLERSTIEELANEVLLGYWGSGAERQRLLTDAGYDYNAVQARVNQMLPGTGSPSSGTSNSSSPSKVTSSPGASGRPSGGSIAFPLGNGSSSNASIIQTGRVGNYSYDQPYDLGNGWGARFDRGKVGNKDHVTVYKDGDEYYMAVDGAKSHKNKSKPGDPPKKVLKKLKEKTGFDWEKARDNYIKMNIVGALDGVGGIILPDDTVLFNDNVYWKSDYEQRVKPQHKPFRPDFMPKLPRSAYIYEPDLIDPKNGGVYVVPIPGMPTPIPIPALPNLPLFHFFAPAF